MIHLHSQRPWLPICPSLFSGPPVAEGHRNRETVPPLFVTCSQTSRFGDSGGLCRGYHPPIRPTTPIFKAFFAREQGLKDFCYPYACGSYHGYRPFTSLCSISSPRHEHHALVFSATCKSFSRTIEIYGPAGLRLFVRQIMKMTLSRTSDKYVVHELLTPNDSVTPCDPRPSDDLITTLHISEPNILHPNELVGLDIRPGPDGFWRAITQGKGVYSPIVVDAGSILHRDPCIGYTFTEVQYPSRKIVIFGDTYDPSAMIPLCTNPSPNLLVHEATDSHISKHADPTGKLSKRSAKEVREKALKRGHSIPEMAGSFAKLVGAQDLVLNHIGGRFPAPRNHQDHGRHQIMRDIEHKATTAWDSGKHAKAAWDFLRVHIPIPPQAEDAQMQTDAAENPVPGPSSAVESAPAKSQPNNDTRSYGNGNGRPRDRNRPDKRAADRPSEPSTSNGDAKRRR